MLETFVLVLYAAAGAIPAIAVLYGFFLWEPRRQKRTRNRDRNPDDTESAEK